LTPPSGGTPRDIDVIYTPPSKAKVAKSREISTKFDLTAAQGHSRSSILVSMESPYVTSY